MLPYLLIDSDPDRASQKICWFHSIEDKLL